MELHFKLETINDKLNNTIHNIKRADNNNNNKK